MLKIVIRIFAILLPVLLLCGLIRKAINTDAAFLPDAQTLIYMFSTCPDFVVEINDLADSAFRVQSEALGYFESATDVVTFLKGIVSYVGFISQILYIGLNYLVIPFRFIVWFFGTFFTVASA